MPLVAEPSCLHHHARRGDEQKTYPDKGVRLLRLTGLAQSGKEAQAHWVNHDSLTLSRIAGTLPYNPSQNEIITTKPQVRGTDQTIDVITSYA